jgi:hypothetical protein
MFHNEAALPVNVDATSLPLIGQAILTILMTMV